MIFFSFTEIKEKVFSYLPWFILKNKKWEIIKLKNWKKHKNHFIIQINNIIDRSAAKICTNTNIFINKSILPKLKKDEYYWNDIIQCKVFNTRYQYLGIVIDLISNTYNDILIIENNLNKKNIKKIMIPFVDQKILQNIDIKNKIIIVKWT